MGADTDDHELLKKEVTFRKALVKLTNELLSYTLDSAFYQTALEWTVDLVPDAQAGSLLIRRGNGCYHFEAAVGFDLEVLKEIQLSDEEMRERSERSKIEKIDVHDLDSRLPPEKALGWP